MLLQCHHLVYVTGLKTLYLGGTGCKMGGANKISY